jgi:guanylate kinase
MEEPHIFFLDGASGAGKTTLALAVAARRSDIALIPRFTTRPKRADADEREYVFISRAEFDAMKKSDDFVEYRDYDFDMSYGLPIALIRNALKSGKHALAIINLGRIKVAQSRCPEAISILVDVPIPILRSRLTERGVHSEAQLKERLENAASVDKYRDAYDRILLNVGEPAKAIAELDSIIEEYS